VGKPTGNDIKEKKLTLPLIFTLARADASTRRRLIYIVKNEHRIKARIQEVIREVQQSGGIQYAEQKMREYRDNALALLETFPDNPERQALAELVRFTTDREK
jgi:octaprenyl-diphosphate synthase